MKTKKLLVCGWFLVCLVNCTQPQNVTQLRQDVLAHACHQDMRVHFEAQIDKQSRLLSVEQLKQSLHNMKDNIKCL